MTVLGKGAWTRWGPAFNGPAYSDGPSISVAQAQTGFPKQFAGNMLNSKLTIQKAWFDAASAKGAGKPAAMGPIHWYPSYGVWDFNDHYWGKGTVGPCIPKSQINGWWYIK